MTNKQNDIMKKLRELFELTKKKFADVKAQDGSILRVDGDVAVGSKVCIISEDGAITEIPDGDHTLEDGTVLTVKSGVIENITPAEEEMTTDTSGLKPAVDEVGKKKKVDTKKDETTGSTMSVNVVDPEIEPQNFDWDMIAEIITDLSNRVSALEQALGSTQAENTDLKKQFAAFKKAPAAEPATYTKRSLLDVIKEENKSNSKANKELKFAEAFAKTRNKTTASSNFAEVVPNNKINTAPRNNPFEFGSGLSNGFSVTND